MKKKSFLWNASLVAILIAGLAVVSCNKKFDEPPTFIEPNITANTTLKALKARHVFGNFEQITEDIIVSGIVVADDKSGNFYKSIVIQDETGGITLRLEGTSLFTSYPVGRRLYIKMKGLYLGDYNRLLQIGGGIDDSDPTRPGLATIASNLFDTYIVKGSTGNTVTPKVVDFSKLTTDMFDTLQNTLIQLNNFEFLPSDTSSPYAPPQQTINRTIRNCNGNTIDVRNSGYATFAGFSLPNGNGSIVAVYSLFGSARQLFIRDTNDVKFNGARCVAPASNIVLGTSPYDINFDNLDNGLPVGVSVRTGASASTLGATGTLTTSRSGSTWANFSSAFRNYASATGLTATTDSASQVAASNRALGVRQTGGTDVGAAFVFEIANTTGKSNLGMTFQLQSLDPSSPRTTTWKVEYATGDNPTSFTAVSTTPATLTTGGSAFSNTAVTANFGTALNNLNSKVWIRIVVLSPTTGGGNRPSSAIDDVKFTFN